MGNNGSQLSDLTKQQEKTFRHMELVKRAHNNALRDASGDMLATVKQAYRELTESLQNSDIKFLEKIAGRSKVEGLNDEIGRELMRRKLAGTVSKNGKKPSLFVKGYAEVAKELRNRPINGHER